MKAKSGRRFGWKLLGIASVVSMLAGPAGAEPSDLGPDGHCGYGDAVAIANAFYPRLWGNNPTDDPLTDLDANTLCQFRTFFEPEEGICFDEKDVFTGGIVFFDLADAEYPDLGLSAREVLQATDVEFEVIGPVGAEWTTFATPVKAGLNDFFGKTVWRQFGLIFTNAVPGDYTVVTKIDDPFGYVELSVNFRVLPHDVAHDLGRPASPFEGSVACP